MPDIVDAPRAAGAVVNRVGHAFFKTRMREEGAVFGGEVSGHYYFRDFWCADSGVIPALLVLELLSVKRGKTMARAAGAATASSYFISGEINSEVADPDAKMKELAERYSDGRVSWLDGVSVDYDDWHFNVRPSNTEPLLRLNLEAFDQRGDGGAHRGAPDADPLVSEPSPAPSRRSPARPRQGSTACGSRRRSRSAGSTPT